MKRFSQMKYIVDKINELKKKKNAIILAHCYQPVEIDLVADYVGDSLALSRMAAQTDADIIIFAGVYFMAQTAKLLSPDKKVLLPQLEAGCRMSDMLTFKQLKEFKAKHPNLTTVCYVNSTAEVKSESDICCTSSNAVEIVKSIGASKVLFVPDTYLGKWVEKQLGNIEIITYPGFCPTHLKIRPADIERARKMYPDALVLAHPECHMAVSSIADYVGSTAGIMKFVESSKHNSFIIATEQGVVDRLKRDYKDKKIYPIAENIVCPNMKMTSLEDILAVLQKENNEIFVDTYIAQRAVKCLDRMLEISR